MLMLSSWPFDYISFIHHSCGMIFNESSFVKFGARCANPSFQVTCENKKSVVYFNYGKHQADAIIASNSSSSSSFCYIITGVSPHNICPIINSFSLPYEKISFFTFSNKPHVRSLTVVRCEKPVDHLKGIYWDISSERCGGEEKKYYSYLVDRDEDVSNIVESCRVEMKVMMSGWDNKRVICNSRKCGYPEVHSEYVNGIEVRWRPTRCEQQQQDSDKDNGVDWEWMGKQLSFRTILLDAVVYLTYLCK